VSSFLGFPSKLCMHVPFSACHFPGKSNNNLRSVHGSGWMLLLYSQLTKKPVVAGATLVLKGGAGLFLSIPFNSCRAPSTVASSGSDCVHNIHDTNVMLQNVHSSRFTWQALCLGTGSVLRYRNQVYYEHFPLTHNDGSRSSFRNVVYIDFSIIIINFISNQNEVHCMS
jgi:hypothetical protein